MQKSTPVVGAKRPKSPILRLKSGVIEYYGYRDYDAASGRWTARDPIAEQGGLKLYGMFGNAAVGKVDVLGMGQAKQNYRAIFPMGSTSKYEKRPWFEHLARRVCENMLRWKYS